MHHLGPAFVLPSMLVPLWLLPSPRILSALWQCRSGHLDILIFSNAIRRTFLSLVWTWLYPCPRRLVFSSVARRIFLSLACIRPFPWPRRLAFVVLIVFTFLSYCSRFIRLWLKQPSSCPECRLWKFLDSWVGRCCCCFNLCSGCAVGIQGVLTVAMSRSLILPLRSGLFRSQN